MRDAVDAPGLPPRGPLYYGAGSTDKAAAVGCLLLYRIMMSRLPIMPSANRNNIVISGCGLNAPRIAGFYLIITLAIHHYGYESAASRAAFKASTPKA